MYRIANMELLGLSREQGVLISWLPEGLGIELSQQKLESLKKQYEAEMEALRQQLEVQREHNNHVDQQLRSQYVQAVSSLREELQDSERQKELDAVVGQLQELHQRQLQQLNAQHMHDTAMQVTAMRVTVEQVQAGRLKLLEEEHRTAMEQLSKEHKEQLNTLQARLISSQDGVSPLGASEELTQQYQSLVQKINEKLEKDVLEQLSGDEHAQGDDTMEDDTNKVPASAISRLQVEAIQRALQTQQEEVLLLRSKLLQEYESMLQQRSEGVSQQSQDVQHLQEQMAELQEQYEKQIAEFQTSLNQRNEEQERWQATEMKHGADLEEVKAKYEQRISEMEQSFTSQMSALQQAATLMSQGTNPHMEVPSVGDKGDSGQVQEDSVVSEQDSISHKLAQERDYVQKTATLTAISDIDSDSTDSPRSTTDIKQPSQSARVQELEKTVLEKTTLVAELEKCLAEERAKMSDLVSQLDSASHKLSDLAEQLQQQKELAETLQERLNARDQELEQAQKEQAESQKLLQELTEKETGLQKEKDELNQQLKHLQEIDGALLTSTPTVEGELKQLRSSLEETTTALQALEARERELQEKLSDAEHQHAEALEDLRQELEHEAQMERETLQSEFRVQLDIELKRQAAELQREFAEELGRTKGDSPHAERSDGDGDAGEDCVPDVPHSGQDVETALTCIIQNGPSSPLSGESADGQEIVITEPVLTSQAYQPAQTSVSDRPDGQDMESDPPIQGKDGEHSPPSTTVSSGAEPPCPGAIVQRSDSVNEADPRIDFDQQLAELCRQFEAEKTQLVQSHQERVEELEAQLSEAKDKYNKLQEDIEQKEGAGVETLLKDRYDMELDLAKNLMQQEFDDTLQAEKKKFVERHRKLMDDFMSEREAEAEDVRQQHQQELEDLRTTLTTQISQLQADLEQRSSTDTAHADKGEKSQDAGDDEGSEETQGSKYSTLMNELKDVKDQLEATRLRQQDALTALGELEGAKEELETLKSQHLESLAALSELKDVGEQMEMLRSEHAAALAALNKDHQAKMSELKARHQEELEAAALDTDVMRSELEQAHQAEVKQLREQLSAHTQLEQEHKQTVTKQTATMVYAQQESAQFTRPGPEAMHAVSEISLPLHMSHYKGTSQSSRDGDRTPDVRSSLEYEETDEEGSVHSFSSMLGKPRTFAEAVKSTPPSSPEHSQRIKQLEAQVERLTQQLIQQQSQDTMTASHIDAVTSPPPSAMAVSAATSPPLQTSPGLVAQDGDRSLVNMLQLDLDRISAERDSIHQTNNRLLQLLSDSVHTYVEVEDTINRRLHTMVAASAPRPHTPTHPLRPDSHADLVTPRGAGLSSFVGVAGDRAAMGLERGALGGAGVVSSPQSDRSWRQREADTGSPTLEETSILSNATDEGLDISQRLTESIFTGPELDAEGEEIVSDARGRLQNAVTRLLEMLERTTQQLLEAKATRTDLLESIATLTRESENAAARVREVEEQIRQEVAAKEYLGLELHKAEGLISGYSSEREALEEQLQSLEEQKEALASDLETTRSRLRDFQDATGELEARRLDVERHQALLQENAGQEAQESAMAGGDATVSEQTALLKEMTSVKQETREQTLQLQHRLAQAEQRLQERESSMEELEKEHQRQAEELRQQVEDLGLQLDNSERQLKSNKHFLDEQMSEREQEREEFLKEVEKLKNQLHDKEKHSDTEGRLQREIQDLTEQLQARIESQSLMHQQTRELQQTLQERELSAQDLRVWINSLERELDQRGDTEEQLKGRIQKLESRLTIGEADNQSDKSASPVLTPRPDSPSSLPLSPTHPESQRRQSRISLEEELKRSRRAEEELVLERDALQRTVQEQLLQMSALRNQLDEMRHWTGPVDPNTTSGSTADLREQLDTEREKVEKAEEELAMVKAEQEGLWKEVQDKRQEVEHLKEQVANSETSVARIRELEAERSQLQSRVTELSDAGPFPPELLDEKNAQIEELRQKLSQSETEYGSLQAVLQEKEELVSDLQDTVHSLQRGEACLDVSLTFNEPMPLNASFTERTSLAQELDQTAGEQEARIYELTAEVEQLNEQLTEQQQQLDQLQRDKTVLQSELAQRDEDLTQLQEERTQKQEALVEKESRLEQLVEQISSLNTEILSLTTFQNELQKDFDTVQSMLEEKEREIESLTKELLDFRSQTDGSEASDLEAELAAVQRQLREQRNVVDEKEEELYELNERLEVMETLKAEVQSLKTALEEKTSQLEQDKQTTSHLKEELAEKTQELEKEMKTRLNLEQKMAEKTEQLEKEAKELQQETSQKTEQLETEKNRCAELQQETSQKTEQLETEKNRCAELQQELEEVQRKERAGRSRAQSFPNLHVKPLEDQVRELKAEVLHLEGVVKDKEELITYLEEEKAADSDLKEKDLADLRVQLQTSQDGAATKVAQLQEALNIKQQQLEDTDRQKQQELEKLQQQLGSKVDTVQQLEAQQHTLQQQAEDRMVTITSLQREVALLKEQLDEARIASTATDDAKALQERLQQASFQAMELQQQLTGTQTRLDQTITQLAEREEQIQQLQGEVQNLQQQCQQLQEQSQMNAMHPKTPDSEDSETDERLKDVLFRAQHTQSLVHASLSSSLPLSSTAEASNLSRWESEPGLSSGATPDIAAQAYQTGLWLRRQQRELAAKNHELASVRLELEAWLRRKDRKAMTMTMTSTHEHTTSIMSLTLRLKEQDVLIASLKRELAEVKEASVREGSSVETGSQEDMVDREHVRRLEQELQVLRSASSMSAEDFAQKVEELREELSQEHQRHVRDIQEQARQDLEVKITELQARHNHEMQQLQQQHQHRLQDALAQQQQELEKEHKTEINCLRVQHQQEIDRLRNEELASLTDASVTQRLHADVLATQKMDQNMIGSLTDDDMPSEVESVSSYSQSDACPPHIQALLDRLRESGEHILSISELDLLRRHLVFPQQEAGEGLQEAWQGEKLSLVKTVHALKELLSQADRVSAGLDEGSSDWRADLVHALVEVYKNERLGLEAELHTLRLQQSGSEFATTIKNFNNRLQEQEQLHQSGLNAMLRAERQSLLSEMEDLQTRLSQTRQEQQDLRSQMTESLAQQEENASNKSWKLQREVQVLEYKLQQEKVIGDDLKKSLESERRHVAELSSELSRDKGTLISVQSELQSTQLHLSRTKDALEREQNRFTSVTNQQQDKEKQLSDALEEEREKNNRLADMLETLRRQHSSLESEVGRSEVMRRERESAENRFIKELQAELKSEREQLHKVTEMAEEERRQRKQVQSEVERERQHNDSVKQELEKLRRQIKKTSETEAAKLADVQRLLHKEQEKVLDVQRSLTDRESTILQHSNHIQQLQTQVQHGKSKVSSLEQEVETERQKADSLAALMDKERHQQLTLQQQELVATKQLRHDLTQAKSEAGEACRQLELEKSRSDSLRLELERAQSELRAVTQHAGVTERQLETEHSSTWSKLRAAQRERDELQIKVHELELELDRLQDKLQDLELELDRSRQRELEARHDVERYKLYPSPRSAPTTPRGGSDTQLQSRLSTFCQQLQSVGQRLHTLTQKQRDHNSSVADSEGSGAEPGKRRAAVEALMEELKVLQQKMSAGEQLGAVSSDTTALTLEVEQLQTTITQLQEEKEELQRQLALLEDASNRRTPRTPRTSNTININNHTHQQPRMPQYMSDGATSDDELVYERSVWANERLSLQMALDSAEHEIDRLKKELRSFRGRFNSEGFMVEADRDKMQRLYGKYLRAESFRKALVYQKKYLLLLLGGYQDSEQETLAIIATMGGQPSSSFDLALRRSHRRLYTIFRSAARMVVAIFRMKYLVRKWKRAMRVGSPVVSGRVSQQYGYVATPSSFTPANTSDRQPASSSTSAHLHTLTQGGVITVTNGAVTVSEQQPVSSLPAGESGRRFYTPPTKEFSQTQQRMSSSLPASSLARRQLIGDLDRSHQTSSGSDDSSGGGGAAAAQAATHDDFIQRLENLQTRLSASKKGEASQHKPSWR